MGKVKTIAVGMVAALALLTPPAHAQLEEEPSAMWSKTYVNDQTTDDCGGNGTANASGFCIANDTRNGLEIGMKFRTSQPVTIVGMRIYRADPGPVRGSLWNADGTLLMQNAFAGQTTQGWQDVEFAQPLAITPGQTYVASYFTPGTRYAFQHRYYVTSRTVGPIQAVVSSAQDPNGVHCYDDAPCGSFPVRGYRSSTYFISPLWRDVIAGDPVVPAPLPTTPGTEPSPPDVGTVDTTRPRVVARKFLTITFSEAIRPSSLNRRTVRLVRRGQARRVALRRGERRVTIRPTPRSSGKHRVVVTRGVQDLAGNPLLPERWTVRVR